MAEPLICDQCHQQARILTAMEIGEKVRFLCWNCKNGGTGPDTADAPAVHVFKPYVDQHISIDGKPVEISSAGQKRQLMRNQWDGNFQVKIEERHDQETDYRMRHWKEWLRERKA